MPTLLITGASRGIGLATAVEFARAGYTVHATMRNPAAAPELARLAQEEKLPIHISAMDVDSDQSVADGIAAILATGPIDVLVNNAGIERNGSVEEMPLADFRAAMETNYFGALRCLHAVVPHMRERRGGCIINVTSVAGRLSNPPLTAYCASKWALEALSEGLACELKMFNVRVAIVEPGIIDTDMARRITHAPPPSFYPHRERFSRLFTASLSHPVPPSVIAEKVLHVVESGTWQLRHPAGPDAAPFLAWRASMTDEEWVELNAAPDQVWYDRMAKDFGIQLAPNE